MKKVLIVTDVNFWEQCSGNRARIAGLVAWLSQHVQLTVVNTGPAPTGVEDILAKQYNADFFVLEESKYLSSTGYGRKLKAFLKDKDFDVIIIEYIHSSYFLNYITGDAKIILDAHDIISDRAEEFKKFNRQGQLYELPKETEFEIFSVYDHVIVICQPDFEKLSTAFEPGRVLLCPHPQISTKHQTRSSVKNISFVASSYLPNRDAIEWFIAECWPKITEKYDVHLNIYGLICSVINHVDTDTISYKGVVSDLGKVYSEADLVINPVRFGAGLKIKNIEALAHGLPLITTTHGARGLEAGVGVNNAFLVADAPDDFVIKIGTLIENTPLRNSLSENANQFIKDNFSPEKCFNSLLTVIND